MNKTKIDIISGFLGAGKTTFIKKIMECFYLKETVVILENEFGKINIDQETLGREGLTVKPIQAGCICCSSSMDLSKGIFEILMEFKPDRILVEPTGIAKLSEIKKILNYPEIEELCKLDHVITIVDAKNYHIRTMISKEFFEDQIRASEVIFLSKTGTLEEEKIHKVMAEIYKINPFCPVVDLVWEGITAEDLKKLIETKNEANLPKGQPRLRINHKNDFESFEMIRDNSINKDQIHALIEEIERGLYGEVHRLKGICLDSDKRYYSVEYVPGETNIRFLDSGKARSAQSLLCIIGRNLDKEKLKTVLI